MDRVVPDRIVLAPNSADAGGRTDKCVRSPRRLFGFYPSRHAWLKGERGYPEAVVREGWVENQGVRIHHLDSDGDASRVPIVLIPSFYGSAEDLSREMASLAPRRCIAVSLRGRGRSDAPHNGYSFDDHISDIEAVINSIGLNAFCLMAFSTSVAYAIGYAARHPQPLAGLVVIDYPARYPAIRSELVDQVLSALPGRVKPHVIRALQRESAEVLLWDHLRRIECHVLILRGAKSGSYLTAEAAEMYQRHLRTAKVVVFPDTGHDVWSDYDRFIAAVKGFLEQVDSTP